MTNNAFPPQACPPTKPYAQLSILDNVYLSTLSGDKSLFGVNTVKEKHVVNCFASLEMQFLHDSHK